MSEVKVNKISPRSGTAITLGDSGDTFTIPSGATLAIAGSVTGFTSAGIDDNATSVAITIDSSERVGIGTTSPANTLDVNDSAGGVIKITRDSQSSYLQLSTSGSDAQIFSGAGALKFKTGSSEAGRFDTSGNFGIGTSSPSTSLHISQSQPIITLTDTDDSVSHQLSGQSSSRHFNLKVDTGGSSGSPVFNLSMQDSIKLSVLNSGFVGIGTSSPDSPLDILTSGNSGLEVNAGTSSAHRIYLGNTGGTSVVGTLSNHAFATITNGSERARIDTSGNLFVAKTSAAYQTVGHELLATGRAFHTVDGGKALSLTRKSSDGAIVDFYRDGTEIGNIGVLNSDNPFFQGTATNHGGLQCGTNTILPCKSSANADNTLDLGQSDIRWKDIYLSGGAFIGGTGTANKLDDYEEGTCTLTIAGSSTSSTLNYVKIGRSVTISGNLSRTGTPTSDNITGFPFSPTGQNFSSIDLMDGGNYPSGYVPSLRIRATNEFRILKHNGNSHTASSTSEIPTNIGFTITYQTT